VPNRAQVGSMMRTPRKTTTPLEPFWLKMALQGVILDPNGVPKSMKNRTFGDRSALGPSKSRLWKGVWKKHENLMKNYAKIM